MPRVPEFKRPKLGKPLFDRKSPWRQFIGRNAAGVREASEIGESELQSYAVYEILRNGSYEAICQRHLRQNLSQADFLALFQQARRGGHLQIPFVNFEQFTFPIFVTDSANQGTSSVLLEQYDGSPGYATSSVTIETDNAGRRHVVGVPQPQTRIRPSGPVGVDSDGALILIDNHTNFAFDFWRATTDGGQAAVAGDTILKAGSVAAFDIGGLGAVVPQQRRQVSARATGLPYLGGLIIPEDFAGITPNDDAEDVAITHALAFTLPSMRFMQHRFDSPNHPPDYMYPATSSETTRGSNNPFSLAAGQRIRLKDKIMGVDGVPIEEQTLAPITRIFLNTLRFYGAYLVDGGLSFGFAAEDFHTAPMDDNAELLRWLLRADGGLPDDKTPWELVFLKLEQELTDRQIRFAVPRTDNGEFLHCNFEVVENPLVPPV